MSNMPKIKKKPFYCPKCHKKLVRKEGYDKDGYKFYFCDSCGYEKYEGRNK